MIEGEVSIPPGIKPVGCRYVYIWKDSVSQEGEIGQMRIAKARLRMKDFKKGGDNLKETFAATGRGTTFRLLMVLAIVLCMECDHIHVNTAFLYADLLKPMFM